MPHLHFTDVAISRLKAEGMYYDDTTPAFGLRVGARRKSWFVIRGRERSRKYFGQYPDKSLADARKEAKALLTQPVAKHERVTLQAAYDLWIAVVEAKNTRLYCTACFRFTDMRCKPLNPVSVRVIS